MKIRVHWAVTIVVLILLILYGRTLRWDLILTTLRGASPLLVTLAIVVNLFTLGVRGVLWWVFLRRMGPVSLSTAIRGEIVGAAFNNVLIANSGEAIRVLLVARRTGIVKSKVLASLAAERLFDPITFLLLFTVGTMIFDLPPALERFRLVAAGMLIVVMGLALCLIRFNPTSVGVISASVGWKGRAIARVRAFGNEVGHLASGPRFAGAALLSATIWISQLAVFSLGGSAAGVDLPLAGVLGALLLTNAGLILRATPGNVGVFQLAYVLAARPFGIDAEAATAAALLIQSIQIIPILILGAVLSLGSVPQEREELKRVARET